MATAQVKPRSVRPCSFPPTRWF